MILKHNNKEYLVLQATLVKQPIGNFYTSVIDWKTLKKITYVNERMFVGYDDDEKEVYRGIQRGLSTQREQELITYVNENPNATFPSSILINIPFSKVDIIELKRDVSMEDNSKFEWQTTLPLNEITKGLMSNQFCLVIPFESGVAQIIDGQHRMSGFSNESDIEFELPVTIFIDQILEEQAEIFAIINGKQTRVAPSLVYELFGLSKERNPYSISHNITKLLNEDTDSPLYKWIRRLGKSNELYKGYLTQSTVVKGILDLICGNIKQAEHDKITMLKGGKVQMEMTNTKKLAPLRKYFVNEEDSILYKILLNFFRAVRDTQVKDWNNQDSVLRKTIGFMGLLKIANELIIIGQDSADLSYDFFKERFSRIDNKILNDANVQLSSKGVNQVYEFYKEVLD